MTKKLPFKLNESKLRLRLKRLVFLVLLLSLLFSVNIYVQDIVINKFTEVELVELNSDINRFKETEIQLYESYRVRLLDYAEWDDAYDYVAGTYDEFVTDNFWWEYTEDQLGINFVMITDLESNILYYEAHDYAVGEIDFSVFESVQPQFIEKLIDEIDIPDSHIFLSTEKGLFVLFANRITDNFNTVEANGYMFFGLRLDGRIFEEISHQIGNNVKIISTDVPSEVSGYFKTSNHKESYKIIDEKLIKTYLEVNSGGDHTYYYLIEWDRTIYETALSSAAFLQTMVLISLVIIILIAFTIAFINIKNTIKLRNMTYYDHLTGVFNRRYYEMMMTQLDKHFTYPIIIVISDINGLKILNDAFGHDNGDDLIKKASYFLTASLNKNGFVARLGGDEFASVFSGNNEDAEEYISKVRDLTSGVNVEGIELSLSYGYSSIESKDDIIHDITRKAEDTMYRQKLLEIPSMRSNAIDTILITLNEKDNKSEEHSRRVSLFASEIAVVLGLPSDDRTSLKTAGLVHDIGKIIIPSNILKNNGVLTDSEYEVIKSHSEIGFRILNSTSQLRDVSKIVLAHHEHWDGNGYPQGLIGEKIPYLSRILSISDALDAMISKRTYNKTYTISEAFNELERCAGTQFDPQLVENIIEHKATLINFIESINKKS